MSAFLLGLVKSIWAWLIALLGFVTLGIVAAYWKQIALRIDPHANAQIDWVLRYIKAIWRRIMQPFRSVNPGSHDADLKAETGERLTSKQFPLPSLVSHEYQPRYVDYEFTWQWSGDEIVNLQILCPMCGQVPKIEVSGRRQGLTDSMRIDCLKCKYAAFMVSGPVEIFDRVTQLIYQDHRQRGLL